MNRDKRPTSRRDLSRRDMLAASLTLMALPAIGRAEAAPLPLSAYARLPAISKAAISPDGLRLALVRHDSNKMWLEDREIASGASQTIEIAGNQVPYMAWADNQRIFIVTSVTSRLSTARYESWVGIIVDVAKGTHYQLYSNMSEYGSNLNGDFHRVKLRRGYAITASNYLPGAANYQIEYANTLYAFTSDHYHGYRLDEDHHRIVNWALRGDGTVAARAEYDEDTRVWKLRFRGARGWEVIHTLKADLDLPLLKGMGRTHDKVLLYFNSGDRIDTYVEVGEDGVFSEALAANRSTTFPLFDPATGLLIGFGHEDGLAHYVWFDKAPAGLRQPLLDLSTQTWTDLIDTSEDARRVILYGEGARSSGAYYLADLDTGKVQTIGNVYPDIPAEQLRPKEALNYTAGDGLVIPAFLTRPAAEWGSRPALVVMPHGGPESFDDGRFDYAAQALASRGYQVLQPNYRGSSSLGRSFVARGYGEWGRGMQSDLSDGVAHLVAQGLADAKRVAIAGGSYGGYAALAGVTLQSGIYNCAVAVAGISHVANYMDSLLGAAKFNRKSRSLMYWRRFLGPENEWDSISPVRHAAQASAPILLIHGRDDAVVAFEQSQSMREALKAAGKPVELLLLKDEDHYLSKEATRIQTLEAMTAFLMQYNPPVKV